MVGLKANKCGAKNEEKLPKWPIPSVQKTTLKAAYFAYGRSTSCRTGTKSFANHVQESFGGEG